MDQNQNKATGNKNNDLEVEKDDKIDDIKCKNDEKLDDFDDKCLAEPEAELDKIVGPNSLSELKAANIFNSKMLSDSQSKTLGLRPRHEKKFPTKKKKSSCGRKMRK